MANRKNLKTFERKILRRIFGPKIILKTIIMIEMTNVKLKEWFHELDILYIF